MLHKPEQPPEEYVFEGILTHEEHTKIIEKYEGNYDGYKVTHNGKETSYVSNESLIQYLDKPVKVSLFWNAYRA